MRGLNHLIMTEVQVRSTTLVWCIHKHTMKNMCVSFQLVSKITSFLQGPWPQGTECVAKYNFKGTSEHDLPFTKGDVLTIIVVTKVTLVCTYALCLQCVSLIF